MRLYKNISSGFTIVELIIVVTIIAILATLSIVSYNGIQAGARDKSVLSDIESMDATQALYAIHNNIGGKAWYSGSGPDADLGFTPSPGNVIDVVANSTDYCIRAYNPNSNKKTITDSYTKESSSGICARLSASVAAGGSGLTISCPTNFIVVPGNSTFSTSDFCIAKYEMKIVGQSNGTQAYSSAFVPESRADGTPWVNISQTNAIAEAQTISGCTGCHLTTEAEWMTIAANTLSVASNWSSGTVDIGYIFSGHNDNVPANGLAAPTDDTDVYNGTGNTTGSNQRRTLTLTNNEVIWDFSGNVNEWTTGIIASGQQPGLSGEVAFATKQWNNSSLLMNGLPSLSRPSAISGVIAGYSSTQGIGRLYSNYGDTSLRGIARSGSWGNSILAGVLSLSLNATPGSWSAALGFRVAK